jgi:hypothetical protein
MSKTTTTANGGKMMTVTDVQAEIEARGVDVGAFWAVAAGGDRTPLLSEDLDRLCDEAREYAHTLRGQ